MVTRLILHVGPHKTGSTALQRVFAASCPMLEAHGVIYPQTGRMGTGHHRIVEALPDTDAPLFRDLKAETAGAETLLLSSENFVVPQANVVADLAAVFPGARIEVIYYLRRLVDLWPSHWGEMIKHGAKLSFGTYLAEALLDRPETGAGALNQFDQLSKLRAAFGSEALRVFSYDRLVATGTDIGHHFGDAVLMGMTDKLSLPSPQENIALHVWQIELIRMMNWQRAARGFKADGTLRVLVLDRLRSARPDWVAEFEALVARAPVLDLDSTAPAIDYLQRRVIDAFGPSIAEDRAAAEAAYLATARRKLPNFDFPPARARDLSEALAVFHDDLSLSGGVPQHVDDDTRRVAVSGQSG